MEVKEKNKNSKSEFEQENFVSKNEKNKIKESIKNLSIQTKVIIVLIFAVIILGSIILITINSGASKHRITAKSSLEKIIEINELSTIDYTYNAIATKYKDNKKDKDNIEYYVAYEGIVTAGIDFNEISIDVNEKDKIINITLPEVEIHTIRVNMGTMDYIYVKKQKEKDSISQEAYKLCKSDLKERLEKEENLYLNAKENAISAVEGLLKPWIDSLGGTYKVVIK